MELSLRRWKPKQLLLSWGAYWAGLIGVTMTPAIRATLRATRLPDGHGSINAGFDNGTLHYTVIENGVQSLSTTGQLSTVLLWVLVPPLALWLLWLVTRKPQPSPQEAIAQEASSALPADAAPEIHVRHADRVPVEREGIRTPNP